MAIIRSFGTVQSVAAPMPVSATPSSAAGSWSGYAYSYATLYRTQPNVRTVVDFLARNVAQLGLHAFRRHSDTDRERLADFPVIQWLTHPNPGTTRYRLFEALMQDMGIYLNAFWLKVRTDDRIGLVRLPPEQVEVEGGSFPSLYRWMPAGSDIREFDPSEIVHFGGYDPCNPLLGLSPLETLRRILLEEIAAQDYRAFYWRNHARMDGVIERDKDMKPWNRDQEQHWKASLGRRTYRPREHRENGRAVARHEVGRAVLFREGFRIEQRAQTHPRRGRRARITCPCRWWASSITRRFPTSKSNIRTSTKTHSAPGSSTSRRSSSGSCSRRWTTPRMCTSNSTSRKN